MKTTTKPTKNPVSAVPATTMKRRFKGVVKSDIFRAAYFAGTFIDDMEIEYPDGAIIAGDFHMANYEETGPTEDALTFSCTFQSTGVVTYTAAP